MATASSALAWRSPVLRPTLRGSHTATPSAVGVRTHGAALTAQGSHRRRRASSLVVHAGAARVTVQGARDLLQARTHTYLDVRTAKEYSEQHVVDGRAEGGRGEGSNADCFVYRVILTRGLLLVRAHLPTSSWHPSCHVHRSNTA